MDTDRKVIDDNLDDECAIDPIEKPVTEIEVIDFHSKLVDGAVRGGIPRTFFQKHGYPSTKTQMTDLDKEMLKKA